MMTRHLHIAGTVRRLLASGVAFAQTTINKGITERWRETGSHQTGDGNRHQRDSAFPSSIRTTTAQWITEARSRHLFEIFDKADNKDGKLDSGELSAASSMAKTK
jgi:hypothetical protein